MSERDAYRRKVEAKIQEQKAELDKAKAQLKGGAADVEIDAHKHIAEIEGKIDGLKAKVEKLAEAGEDAWEDVRKGIDDAWDDVSGAAKKALDRFRS